MPVCICVAFVSVSVTVPILTYDYDDIGQVYDDSYLAQQSEYSLESF